MVALKIVVIWNGFDLLKGYLKRTKSIIDIRMCHGYPKMSRLGVTWITPKPMRFKYMQ